MSEPLTDEELAAIEKRWDVPIYLAAQGMRVRPAVLDIARLLAEVRRLRQPKTTVLVDCDPGDETETP